MPKCTILVGVPGSGKSTWIKEQEFLDDTWVMSTDNIIEAIASMCGMTYNECFNDLIKFADKVVWADLKLAAEDDDTIYNERYFTNDLFRNHFCY